MRISDWISDVCSTDLFNPEGIRGPAHAELDKRRQAKLREAAGEADDHTSSVAASLPSLAADGPASGRPALSVGSLTVTYGGVTAVDDVAFEVAAGTITGLIGPNGAGKTTTMDALCGFTDCKGAVDLAGRAPRENGRGHDGT